MRKKLVVDHIALSDHNEELGLYQFILTFTDQSKARVFVHKDPEWRITAINRLLNIPCTICRKDYYCKCFEKYIPDIEQQLIMNNHITDALTASSHA